MRTRENPNNSTDIQIVREVPLWGVVSGVAVLIMQLLLLVFYGGQFYRQQEEQGKAVQQMALTMESIKARMEVLGNDSAVLRAKDSEHDRRITELESLARPRR